MHRPNCHHRVFDIHKKVTTICSLYFNRTTLAQHIADRSLQKRRSILASSATGISSSFNVAPAKELMELRTIRLAVCTSLQIRNKKKKKKNWVSFQRQVDPFSLPSPLPGSAHLKKNFHISLSHTSVNKWPPRTPPSSIRARSCLAPPLDPTELFFDAT
jgi:hypothetical protein